MARFGVGVELEDVHNEGFFARFVQLDAGVSPEVVHQTGNAGGAEVGRFVTKAEIMVGPLANAKGAIYADTNSCCFLLLANQHEGVDHVAAATVATPVNLGPTHLFEVFGAVGDLIGRQHSVVDHARSRFEGFEV